ncbi:MAG: carboxypeptidase regulatory-like domain-containing protein [Acidobacteriaceae bacterium]|nr:carboxypeptidase regulatory-like domain-containing protein [Acidobacteriaceae bacterium]
MRVLVILATLLWPLALRGQLTGNTSVSGVVINSADSAPLAHALVILHLDGPGNLAATAVTDAEGRFSFENLPPRRYLLEARHTGFDNTWFGACAAKRRDSRFNSSQRRSGPICPLLYRPSLLLPERSWERTENHSAGLLL